MKLVVVSVVMIFLLAFQALKAQCDVVNTAFQSGEEVQYTAYYNWKFIWLNAGVVNFTVRESVLRNQPVFHFLATGRSHRSYDLFFKVRDRFESYASKDGLRPFWYERDTYEGGYAANDAYTFDYVKNRVILRTVNSDRPFKVDTLSLPACAFDVLTAIYFCRNIDFSTYEPGEKIPLTMIIDDGIYDLFIRYHGKETIETRTREVYNCINFSVLLVEGTIFQGGEDLHVWVTDDQNRLPVLVEAKILIGSVKAVLQSAKNLRHPLSARVQ